jgi:hypothetical protein
VRKDLDSDAAAAFSPTALAECEHLKDRGVLHKYVLHRRSSQAFALNLFAPLGARGLRKVLIALGIDDPRKITWTFEWSAPDDVLREGRPGSSHATQIDVRVDCLDSSGNRTVVLVEVKFTEDGFGECSAFTSVANPWRDVCRTSGLFGGEPERCWIFGTTPENPPPAPVHTYSCYPVGRPIHREPSGMTVAAGSAADAPSRCATSHSPSTSSQPASRPSSLGTRRARRPSPRLDAARRGARGVPIHPNRATGWAAGGRDCKGTFRRWCVAVRSLSDAWATITGARCPPLRRVSGR